MECFGALEGVVEEFFGHDLSVFAEVFEEATDPLQIVSHAVEVGEGSQGSTKDEAIPAGQGALDMRLIFLYKVVQGVTSDGRDVVENILYHGRQGNALF